MMKQIDIITVDNPKKDFLLRKTEKISDTELDLAQEIYKKLFLALKPHFPSAGLAAPQIGILKSVFIYSFDRDPKNLEAIINPSFAPVSDKKVEGWEGCLSVILSNGIWKMANVCRYEKIQVTYQNLNGKVEEKVLEGFAARVFQHEYDHLQGIVNIDRQDATIKAFKTREELESFIVELKKHDSSSYKPPK